jgi:hypothetical protein
MKIGKNSLQQMLYLVSVMDKASAIALVSQTTYFTSQEKSNGAKDISRTSILRDDEFQYPVVVPWNSQLDTVTAWNEVCAQGMEMFGLPGDRYITDANVNDMTWWFRNEQDALLMTLKFSEQLAC